MAGFLGPNGAGKSTTIRILLGLVHRDAGSVRVFGRDPVRDAVAIHRRLAYVPGDVALWPRLTGGECIDLLLGMRGVRVDRGARDDLVDRFDLDPSRRVSTYSKGNRQKIVLVAAFAGATDLVVFDEPASGLDPVMENIFAECVGELAERRHAAARDRLGGRGRGPVARPARHADRGSRVAAGRRTAHPPPAAAGSGVLIVPTVAFLAVTALLVGAGAVGLRRRDAQ